MKKTVIAIVAGVLVIYLTIFFMVSAPMIAHQKEIDFIKNKVSEQLKKPVQFVNQFNLKTSQYFFRQGQDNVIVMSDASGSIVQIFSNIVSDHNFGYVNDRLVFVEKQNNIEIWRDVETNEVIFERVMK